MTATTSWKCEVCGYIHQGSEPPETCPVCGVDREMFTVLEIAATKAPDVPPEFWKCTICDYVHTGWEPPDQCPVCGAGSDLFKPVIETETAVFKSMDIGHIVILGGGIAGLTAAEQARFSSPDVTITLVSKEPDLPYYRLNLTRFLAGEVDEPSLIIQGQAWFDDRKISLRMDEAVAIDREKHSLTLRSGDSLEYDRLILAHGSHPFMPPIPGITREGVFSLRTRENAQMMINSARESQSCVCIGGGLLGLETAGALAKRGLDVTILEGFDWLLPRQLTPQAGQLLQKHIEATGLKVQCGIQVKEITGDEKVAGIILADGSELSADIVVVTTGIRPNSYLARQCGLKVNHGIIVDDTMKTSDPAILAAGDVAEHRGVLYGIWPAAYAQGYVAGLNAAGRETEFSGLPPSTRLKVMDIDVFSIGDITQNDASYTVYESTKENAYYAICHRDGRIAGANLLGDTSLAGPIKTAIEEQKQLPECDEINSILPDLGEYFR